MNEEEQMERIIAEVEKVIMGLEKEEPKMLSKSMLHAFSFLSASTIIASSIKGHEEKTLDTFINNLRAALKCLMDDIKDEL